MTSNSISDSIFFPSEISWSQSLGCFYQHSGIINTYQDGPFTYDYSIPVFLQPPASSFSSFSLQFQSLWVAWSGLLQEQLHLLCYFLIAVAK